MNGMLALFLALNLSVPTPVTETPRPETTPPPPKGPGLTKETSVEVCQPAGERAYLSRLRCSDGTAPEFSRDGSIGPRHDLPGKDREQPDFEARMGLRPLRAGEVDYHMIDRYTVKCTIGTTVVFLDMYHCSQPAPTVAPDGFTTVPAP